MLQHDTDEIGGNYCPDIKSRWKNYGNYRLLLWAWMMNEVTIMFSPSDISHSGFYAHIAIQTLAVIFFGMPLVYSEICLAQYTNCNIFTMWNYFPLFRNVGYGTLYLIILKTLYMLVLTAWYLVYTFYSGLDTPPWFSCDDFRQEKCMVKRVNVSVFQHCLEAQILFDDDCGMKTASSCFFGREIGDNCTMTTFQCVHPWKMIVTVTAICTIVYILSIKNEKFIQIIVKLIAIYVCFVILVLFCVALSTSGTWYATKITINWNDYNFHICFASFTRGFLSVGTGYGIIIFLSRDVSFRSPATMTSICTSLLSVFVTFMFGIIAFGGIKTMSYYHGEEENVIEIGSSLFFQIFASMSEILIYFDAMPVWGFLWFSVISICLFCNFWILYLFQKEIILSLELARKFSNFSGMLLMILLICFTLPFLCSDLTRALTEATQLIQISNSFLFSISLYWIYGYNNHNVDIIFMIGIKANWYWKLAWLLNPIFLITTLYSRWLDVNMHQYTDSYHIKSINMNLSQLLTYILLSIYIFIIVIGMLVQLLAYYQRGELDHVIEPGENWGPRDKVLFRSRKMFVPEIMTREFLYRQVLIRGYYKKRIVAKKQKENNDFSIESPRETTWSALTSN